MQDNCPHCGSKKHETRPRTYTCGTCYSGRGEEYRTEPCKIAEASIGDRANAIAEKDAALAAQVTAEAARDIALAEASRDRAFAYECHERLDKAMQDYREDTMNRLRSALDLPTQTITA